MKVVFSDLVSDRICLVVIQMSGLSLVVIECVVYDGEYFLGWAFDNLRRYEC